jgi:hypothetical protein
MTLVFILHTGNVFGIQPVDAQDDPAEHFCKPYSTGLFVSTSLSKLVVNESSVTGDEIRPVSLLISNTNLTSY